tara:strand:- start:312 stop:1244 length:933 start_codon:yes stop_codon:yes gene_type:complete
MDAQFKKQYMNIEESLKKNFGKKVFFEEDLSKYSWFNLGGPAEIFFRPDNVNQLVSFFKFFKEHKKKINIIGAGSNTLIREGGVEGVVIKLSSKFSYTKLLENNIIQAGGATLEKAVSDFAMKNSLAGFEFLSCIPGSVGGGIKMNSGCYGEDISNIIYSVEVIDQQGNIKNLKSNQIKFFYRGSDLDDNLIILSAKFKGRLSEKKDIEKKQLQLIHKKKKSQPQQVKTCGSTFKNSENKKAWELIKESNCEKMSVGSAKISEKHCNFFINQGNATSKDIEELINKVKKQVFNITKTNLELEIKIIGKNK